MKDAESSAFKTIQAVLKQAKKHTIAHVRASLGKMHKDDNSAQSPDIGYDVVRDYSIISIGGFDGLLPPLTDIGNDAGGYFLAQLGVNDRAGLVNQVDRRAVVYAKARAAELVTDIDESTRDMLRGAIAAAMEDNLSIKELTEKLASEYAFSDDRARLIAETEVAAANGHGSLNGMREARSAGVDVKKVWICDPDPCEDCEENGDAGAIELDEEFPSGDEAPLAHPNCKCVLVSETQDEEGNEQE